MSRQIKLIWDFRGEASAKSAEHHEIHLKEYLAYIENHNYKFSCFCYKVYRIKANKTN